MTKKIRKPSVPLTAQQAESRRKKMEGIATLGLILVAAAMLIPFASFMSQDVSVIRPGAFSWVSACKWIYAAGAVIFTVARMVSVSDPDESLRLRRLRRLEFWAGMAFCIGAFFWFYNEQKYSDFAFVGPLAIMKDTVVFSLAGAMIQVVASWLIVWRKRKEMNGDAAESTKKDKRN